MITLHLSQAKLKVWRGYTANRTGFLPSRMSWMEPEAAKAVMAMQEAAEWRIEFSDGYRSCQLQLDCITNKAKKRRLYAPPTKSGHNFGWSVDVQIEETLENLRASSNPELVMAGQSRDHLARFMSRFGFTGISNENWHFNHLGPYATTQQKIEALFASQFKLSDIEVQRALNQWMGTKLKIDGDVGPKTRAAVKKAQQKMRYVKGVKITGNPDAWTRRLLAGMTLKVEKAA